MRKPAWKRWAEGVMLKFVLWLFSLTEEPCVDEACTNPDCSRCVKKRAKRRAA